MSPGEFYSLLYLLMLPRYGYRKAEIEALYPFERDVLLEMHVDQARKEAEQ